MRIDVPRRAVAKIGPVDSLERSHPRYRPPVTGVTAAELPPVVTINRLNQDAAGAFSLPALRMCLKWHEVDQRQPAPGIWTRSAAAHRRPNHVLRENVHRRRPAASILPLHHIEILRWLQRND